MSWPGVAAAATLLALVSFFYRGLLQGLILGDYDAFVYFYPLRYYAAEAIKAGRFPLWNPDLFMGVPFFANVQTGVLYPPNVLFLFLPTPYAFSASVVLHVLLAGTSMYLFARGVLETSRVPALIAASAFMLSGFLAAQVGHLNQLNVSAWLPLLLVVFDSALRRRSPALAIATGLLGATQFLAGHTQEWYFSMAVLGLFAIWRMLLPRIAPAQIGDLALLREAHKGNSGRVEGAPGQMRSGRGTNGSLPSPRSVRLMDRLLPAPFLAVAVLVMAGTVAVQIFPTLELSRESLRGGGMSYWDATSFSLPPATALYTLLPTYPSTLFSEFVGYVGIATLVLAAVAVVRWPSRPITVPIGLLAALGIFMALGRYNPASPILFNLVPGLDIFRVPARWLLVYTFGIAGLAGLGAQQLLDIAQWRRTGARVVSPHGEAHPVAQLLVSALLLGMGVLSLAVFARLAEPPPTSEQVLIWAGLAIGTLVLAAVASLSPRVGPIALGAILLLLALDLAAAGGNMDFRHPIPAEAFRPERTSTSFILADAASRQDPGRLLSFASDQYEVKETPDYKRDYDWLGEESLHQFLVAVKLSETLAPNVSLLYGLQSVDGYDGGVLPLRRWAEFKSLMLNSSTIPADNPLRRHLTYLPPDRFLDLMNVRYILGTKIQDTSVDNVYYDRGISVELLPGESVSFARVPDIMATAVGLISSTEGARELPGGTAVAELVLTDEAGGVVRLPIRAGQETGETPERDGEFQPPAHAKPRSVAPWSPEIKGEEYYAKIPLPARARVKELAVANLSDGGKLRVRAVTLIDDAGAISAPLVLSDRLDRQLFFDMKVYTNRATYPRAFMVYSSVVRDDGAALEMLRTGTTDARQTAILAPSPTARAIFAPASVGAGAAQVSIRSYEPERIVLDVGAAREGYLVLLDSFYPGWRAEIGGREVPIERANHLFRAVLVPEGRHEVVFRYAPQSLESGVLISATTLGLVLVAFASLAIRRVRRPGP